MAIEAEDVGQSASLFSDEENSEALGGVFDDDEVDELEADEAQADETETDEEEDVSQEDDVDEGQEKKTKELNDNLNKALKAERDKRKASTKQVKELEASLQSLKESGSMYEEPYKKLLEQIHELDLQDILKVDSPKERDPQLDKLLKLQEEQERQAQVQTFFGDMRDEVDSVVGEYPNIDKTSNEQGAVLSQMIVSNVSSNGMEMEEAVATALSALNGLLASTKVAVKKARKPEVRPRKKIREASPARKRTEASRKASKGDFSGVFGNLAAGLLDK